MEILLNLYKLAIYVNLSKAYGNNNHFQEASIYYFSEAMITPYVINLMERVHLAKRYLGGKCEQT